MIDPQSLPTDARARASDLLPQTHGGALRREPPHDSVSIARALGMRAVRKEVRRLFAEASVANAKRVLELCLSDNEQVSIVALREYHERFYGKAGDVGLIAEEGQHTVNVDHLTPDQRRVVHEALMLLAGGK